MEYGDERLSARFWSKVRVNPETDCWEWTASRLPAGYGRFSVNRKMTTAHRVSYAAAHGPIPAGMEIDHRCYERSCVNPEHLRAATDKQNQENRVSVGRGKSKYRGVHWNKRHNKWHVKLSHHDKTYYFGGFDDEDEAGRVAREKRDELYTHNDSDHRSHIARPDAKKIRGEDEA